MKFIILGFIMMTLVACATTESITPTNSATVAIQKQHPLEVKTLKKGLKIYFQPKSTEISAEYQPTLSVASQLLQANKNFILQIEGHTDSSGSLASNNKVSLSRANIVKEYLVNEYKINPEQISATGFGPTKPIADNKTQEGKAKNRRVEVTLKIK